MNKIQGFGANKGAYAGPTDPQTFEPTTPGEILESIRGNGPRVVRPRWSGYLPQFEIKNDYLSLDIPPGTILCAKNQPPYYKKTVHIFASDVLISNLRIGAGAPDKYYSNQTDSLAFNGAKRVGLTDCHVWAALDEQIDMSPVWQTTNACEDITIQRTIIGPGLRRTFGDKGPGLGFLISRGCKRITSYLNLFYSNWGRNLRAADSTEIQVINCVGYNHGDHAMDWKNATGDIIGNVYLMGPDTMKTRDYILNGDSSVSVYIEDNWQAGAAWRGSVNVRSTRLCHPKVAPVELAPFAAFYEVMTGAGPLERSPLEKRIIRNVLDGTGRIIANVDEIGGWPVIEDAPPEVHPIIEPPTRKTFKIPVPVPPLPVELEGATVIETDLEKRGDDYYVVYTGEVEA